MKKFLLYVIAATLFAACSVDTWEDMPIQTPDSSEEFYVSFDEEDSRIQLGDAGQPVWTEGDQISIFNRSNANDKYQFAGKTGDTSGSIQLVKQGTSTVQTTRIVAVYPYNANYWFNWNTYEVEAALPKNQTYLKDSYGVGSSIMVASSNYKRLSFKNVCGWLKLQLTGSHTVTKIEFKGNNNEQVAGDLYINTTDASCKLPSLMDFEDDATENDSETRGGATRIGASLNENIVTVVSLGCGEGVALDPKTPTAFYIALPPQTFNNGISIRVHCTDGLKMDKSTSNKITIQRNHILPMASIEVKKETPEASKIEANFTADNNIKWSYAEDALQDSYKYDDDYNTVASYSRQNVVLTANDEVLSQLSTLGIAQLLADATPTFYTVEGENEVLNTSIEASVTTNESGDYLLHIANFEWGKTYKVQYTFQEEGEYEVVLNAIVATDADRSNDIVKLSSDDVTVQYQDSLVFDPFAEGAPVIDLSTAYQTIAAAYDITEEEFLAAVLGITDGKEYSATSFALTAYDGDGNVCQTLGEESKELWQTMSDYTVSVGYSDQLITSGPYKVVYSQVITLWYGQQIELEMTINIKYPRWDFVHNTNYVSYANNIYSSLITPRRLPGTTSPIYTGLDIALNLNEAFSVCNDEGAIISAEELVAQGLEVVFVIEETDTEAYIDKNNVLYYYSSAAELNVRGELYKVNADASSKTRISTKFDGNGVYSNYVVKSSKFVPISKPSAKNATASLYVKVGHKGLNKIYLLEHINLTDNREGGEPCSLVDPTTHSLLIGDGKNGYAEGVSVADLYKISVAASISNSNTSLISFENVDNCPVVILDTTQMPSGMDKDYYCDAVVTIKTAWITYAVSLKIRFYKVN